jgi:transcriptional regulator with XRE-family HTH domain
MAVTIEDVARAAGVSKSTVSLVINGKSVVKLETKYKVLQTIDKLGYIPNVAAQELTTKRKQTLGMVINTSNYNSFDSGADPTDLSVVGYEDSILAAKAANLLATLGEYSPEIDTYFGTGLVTAALKQTGKKLLPVITVQTAASSGAHLTKYSNITDPVTGQKKLIVDEAIIPARSVFDYAVTESMPTSLSIDGALDGIAHCLEVFFGVGEARFDQVKEFALTGIELVVQYAKRVIDNLHDLEAREALENSINSPGREKLKTEPDFRTVIVVSDNTRPVPYRGESGILWPVVERLLRQGIAPQQIAILVATGTHRAMTEAELKQMLEPAIFELGIAVFNHNCHDESNLAYLGETKRGSRIWINRRYMEADLKILTGLVESHFMAGVSGGRKSVCPGLIGEASTYVFHGAPMLASSAARDLNLEGNPCHEEALEVAKRAGADYIINVTLDHRFQLTGVFAGELEAAHLKAAERVKAYAAIAVHREYDIVITHAGFVGINHYQAGR